MRVIEIILLVAAAKHAVGPLHTAERPKLVVEEVVEEEGSHELLHPRSAKAVPSSPNAEAPEFTTGSSAGGPEILQFLGLLDVGEDDSDAGDEPLGLQKLGSSPKTCSSFTKCTKCVNNSTCNWCDASKTCEDNSKPNPKCPSKKDYITSKWHCPDHLKWWGVFLIVLAVVCCCPILSALCFFFVIKKFCC